MKLEFITAAIEKAVPNAVLSTSERPPDNDELLVNSANILAICELLKNDGSLDFKQLTDLTVVDMLAWPGWHPTEDDRFQVVYQLYSYTHNRRLRLKATVSEQNPEIDSVFSVWKAADWAEREAWEMFGLTFTGHPNLDYLFLYEGFKGNPLRKDYPLKGQQPIVPLRFPIEIRDEPAHMVSQWQKEALEPLSVTSIDNETRMPTSMLRPNWRSETAAKIDAQRAAIASHNIEPTKEKPADE